MAVSVKFPFQIANGSVATTSLDREALRSKVMFCLGSQINERVMRPQWGIDILSTSYSVGADLAEAVPEAIAFAFQRWFPSLRLIAAEVTINDRDPTYVDVLVRYGQIDSDIDEVARLEIPVSEGA
jgi:hypothetical protein